MLTGHRLDGGGHGGREQRRPALGRQGGGDRLHVLGEAHAQHLVSLVKHEVAHSAQVQGALVDEVDDAPGGTHDHLGARLQGADLRAVGGATVDGDDVEPA